jgi:hypothetical protein
LPCGIDTDLSLDLSIGWQSRDDVGVREITTFEQQRFTICLGQRIGETVAEIQPCRMSAAFAKIPVGLTCDFRLYFRDRFDPQFRRCDELIKSPSGDRIGSRLRIRRSSRR